MTEPKAEPKAEPTAEGVEVVREDRAFARMELTYTLTEDDFIACEEFHAGSTHANWARVLEDGFRIVVLLLAAAFVGWQIYELTPAFLYWSLAAVLVLPAGYLALVWWVRRRLARREAPHDVRRTEAGLLAQKLEISPLGVRLDSELMTAWFDWRIVGQLGLGTDHLFLYAPGATFILPKRAFRDDFEFKLFLSTVRQYREDARHLSEQAPVPPPSRDVTRPEPAREGASSAEKLKKTEQP
jgi:hypothetical protein